MKQNEKKIYCLDLINFFADSSFARFLVSFRQLEAGFLLTVHTYRILLKGFFFSFGLSITHNDITVQKLSPRVYSSKTKFDWEPSITSIHFFLFM